MLVPSPTIRMDSMVKSLGSTVLRVAADSAGQYRIGDHSKRTSGLRLPGLVVWAFLLLNPGGIGMPWTGCNKRREEVVSMARLPTASRPNSTGTGYESHYDNRVL